MEQIYLLTSVDKLPTKVAEGACIIGHCDEILSLGTNLGSKFRNSDYDVALRPLSK